jgi:hypothetical protein
MAASSVTDSSGEVVTGLRVPAGAGL